jgi:ketosteroid isomerase-like protein
MSTGRLLVCVVALLFFGCTPTPPPPLTPAEVQEFVRQYIAATNTADASKLMELVQRDPTVSSIALGKVTRGWEAMRVATDESSTANPRIKIAIGTIDVTTLGNDAALAIASMSISSAGALMQRGRYVTLSDVPGAFTMVVRRTPEGLRLVHEHYSVHAQ